MNTAQWLVLLRYASEQSGDSIATIVSFMEATQPDEHAQRVFVLLRRKMEGTYEDGYIYGSVELVRWVTNAAYRWADYLEEEGRCLEAEYLIEAIIEAIN